LQEVQVEDRPHSRQGGYHVQCSNCPPRPPPPTPQKPTACAAGQSEPPDSSPRPQTPATNGVQGPCRMPQTPAHPSGPERASPLSLRLPGRCIHGNPPSSASSSWLWPPS